MKLTARQVNVLKANIEGGYLKNLYNRLHWNTPKTIHLSIIEKDVINSIIDSPYNDDEDNQLLKELTKDR